MKVEREWKALVTPELAKKYLETSKGNRNLRAGNINKLVSAMASGKFIYDGSPIRFNESGDLIDGHHRLTACVKSGVPFQTDIAIVPNAAAMVIDTGAIRSTSDALVFAAGVDKASSANISTAIRIMIMHDKTLFSDYGISMGGATYSSLLNNDVVIDYYNANKDEIHKSHCAVMSALKASGRNPTPVSAAQYIAMRAVACRFHDECVVDEFIQKVLSGIGIEQSTPEDHCRRFMLAVKSKQTRSTRSEVFLTFVKLLKVKLSGRSIVHYGNARYRFSVDKVPSFR